MFTLLKEKINKRVLSIITIFLTCIMLFYLVYATSPSITLTNVVLCKNLDNEMSPVDVVRGETTPTDRLILFFDYSKANIGLTLRVVWYYNNTSIAADTLKLLKTNGNRSIALLSTAGSYLPSGAYCVKIFLGDDELKQLSFIIS